MLFLIDALCSLIVPSSNMNRKRLPIPCFPVGKWSREVLKGKTVPRMPSFYRPEGGMLEMWGDVVLRGRDSTYRDNPMDICGAF